MPNPLHGRSLIGFSLGEESPEVFHAGNPATGQRLEPGFHPVGPNEWQRSVELAEKAAWSYGQTDGKTRGRLLRAIAAEIEASAEEITRRAVAETGLPEGRITGEIARTVGQLRLFAGLVEEGSWVDARIDTALPDRRPLPKPDLRSMRKSIGPVAVFCASNFPLAFSVAGGDTASALAGGNPVVVKAHPAHPGTAELVGKAVLRAVRECELPEGTFSLLHGPSHELGRSLATHAGIKAVAFTGSRQGGLTLSAAAAVRPEPIPVFAEMSSINPIFVLPGALGDKGQLLAEQFLASLTLGVGQFCTNPGLVVLPPEDATTEFLAIMAGLAKESSPGVMLHRGIREAYADAVARRGIHRNVRQLTVAREMEVSGECLASPVLFVTDAETFLTGGELQEEIFGPSATLVQTASTHDFERIAENLEGQLTASIFGTEEELLAQGKLVEILRRRAGRLLFNQFPTGVEVCPAMVHGGPYPATLDGRSTSVGTEAIVRFVRRVSYQNFPEGALPAELQDANPLKISRLVNGKLEP